MKTLLSLLLVSATLFSQAKTTTSVKGIVFNDINQNGLFDKQDQPLENIAVSTSSSIAKTNSKGEFKINIDEKDIVFVVKPSNFEFALKENKVPDFYRICYQKSTPDSFTFRGIEATEIPEMLYFPMYQVEVKSKYQAQMVGDIQAPTSKEVEFFQDKIVPELHRYPSDFRVLLGDIADNNLDIYPEISGALKGSEIPNYMVLGNHDMNYKSASIENEAETFRSHFGPDYYSFNYGNTHFIVLNTVLYNGWNTTENKRGGYNGGLHAKQLNWLKQDLSIVPTNSQIVLMAHIPLITTFTDSANIIPVFELLKPFKKIVAIYGHLHTIGSWEHNSSFLWEGEGKFDGQIAGAACGSWWMAPYGLDSIPDATCADGAPSGIFLYEFGNESYSKKFVPADKHPDYQLRISLPAATISSDSLASHFIYVNVFDGNDRTTVHYSIDGAEMQTMQQTPEIDPYMKRNHYLRFNRDNWTPGMVTCTHLWKAPYPTTLSAGKHTLKASATLADGKTYETIKVFEVVIKSKETIKSFSLQ